MMLPVNGISGVGVAQPVKSTNANSGRQFNAKAQRRKGAEESQPKKHGGGRRLSRSTGGFPGVLRLVLRTQPRSGRFFAERNEVGRKPGSGVQEEFFSAPCALASWRLGVN